jgi:hypothetical protein
MSDVVTTTLECGGEQVMIGLDEDAQLVFFDYDIEADLAATELGFEQTPCGGLYAAYSHDRLRALLDHFLYKRHTALCDLAVNWFELVPIFDPDAAERVGRGEAPYRFDLIVGWCEPVIGSLRTFCRDQKNVSIYDLNYLEEVLKQTLEIIRNWKQHPLWVEASVEAGRELIRYAKSLQRQRVFIGHTTHFEALFTYLLEAVGLKDGPRVAAALRNQLLRQLFATLVQGQAELLR